MGDRVANVPVEEYRKVADAYDPERFISDSMVRLAKRAGMKITFARVSGGEKRLDGLISSANGNKWTGFPIGPKILGPSGP